MLVVTMPCSQVTKLGQYVQQIIEQILDNFQLKNYFQSINIMSKDITIANSKIADDKEFLRKE